MSYAGAADDMRRKLTAILIGVTLSGICTAQTASVDQVFDSVLATRHFAEVSIAPDAQRIVWIEKSVKNDSDYAHTVYVADLNSKTPPQMVGPGDPRAEFGTSSVTWSPDSKEFAYIVEIEPGGQSDLRIASADGSKSRSLAILKGGAISPRWSPDGRNIALLYSEAAPAVSESARVVSVGKEYQQQRLVLVDAKSGSIRVLSPADLFIYEYDWSPDNRQIAITAAPCCSDAKGQGGDNWWTAELYRLDVESGNAVSIFKSKLQIASPKWSPDGGRIAFIGGLMSDFIAPGGDLFVIPASGGEPQNVTPGLRASVTGLAWTGRGEILTTQIVDGEGGIVLVHTSNEKSESLWQSAEGPFDGGLVFGISLAKDGRTAAAVRQSFDHAPEVWAGPVGQWRQISAVNKDRKSPLGKAESVHWTSDGMQVQGWLVYPTNYSPDQRYPMVVSVHGGPAASALSHWPAAFDNVGILSSFGYFILYPNPRGSFGSGESFTQGNVKNLGYGDLRDIEAGVKQVIGTLPVDPRRVGITGWSYGGFMAMWAITQTDIFRASVAGPGVSDWESYYGQTDIEKWVIPYFGTSAYDDPAIYAKSSPVRFVQNAHAATLFYVGNQDSICPAPQTFQLWRALKHHGVETGLLSYSNEGHGITQPADQRDLINRTAQWFDEHLR
jgi:dipeptidyl aminopeptidase/acylaminoacyl peptidase